ncbi:hypothetical protein RO3G_10347 [Rhizopus delemar RA 99-880]|uniref:Reverse transcriptase zinc-binding domain-containing protein n=1 Tax=Rhizopus delemar (strain RA 99-880 / ATCC MYA-4621 / FGSC 9543 / NRRL 43880) TaxID=246409 RepID=I1CB07_RHIO9|nr:hypothetical protein RO3G_10347 [Rhizopus delemar RA 99-880]|eukprot:EIE85637.1 hypothetical protein RO3G_10347 [Rhizopus delemar RA 99-880]
MKLVVYETEPNCSSFRKDLQRPKLFPLGRRTGFTVPQHQCAVFNSLPVASTLHQRNVTSCTSTVCRICHSDVEDAFYFVIGCPLKWQFWSSALSLFCLTDQFPESTSVWSALATLSSPKNRYTVCPDYIRPLRFIFLSLWRFHWRCVLNGTLWSLSGSMNFFQQDSKLLFESSLVMEFQLFNKI